MSRPLRIQYPGAWYHVMNRGLNHRRIFHNDVHRQLFFDLLSDIHKRYGVQTHAYCLMDNHYHLLLHTPNANISRAMRHLDGLYTQRFNRDEKRDGPLFRGRYKAILVEADPYLLQLTRYIHLNPVSAKLCSEPAAYAWSSYRAYLKHTKQPNWLYCDKALLQCSETQPIKYYREFVERKEIDENISKVFSKAQWPSHLGSGEWIERIKIEYETDILVDDEIPASKALMQNKQPDDIHVFMQNIATYYGVSLTALKHRGSRYEINIARNMLIYLAVECCGYENKKIAEAVGRLSGSGVSKIKKRMQEKLESDHLLQAELEELKQVVAPMSNVQT